MCFIQSPNSLYFFNETFQATLHLSSDYLALIFRLQYIKNKIKTILAINKKYVITTFYYTLYVHYCIRFIGWPNAKIIATIICFSHVV